MPSVNPSRFRPRRPPKSLQGALFNQLNATEQAGAIRRLRAAGLSDMAISGLTGVPVAQIRALMERPEEILR